MLYPIVIHKDKNSDFGVIVPDIPGCYSVGASLELAIENTEEAVLCHLEGLLLDKESIPVPSSIDDHIENPEYSDGIWFLVQIDLTKVSGKTRRVNITIPERLLRLIDYFLKSHKGTRSSLIADAVLNYISLTQTK